MPFSSGGVFTPAVTFQDGTTATAEDQNSQDTDLANGLTQCWTRAGLAPPTANLSVGGYKFTELANGSNPGDSINYGQLTSQVFAISQMPAAAQLTAFLNLFSSTLQGLVPASAGGTQNFMRADGTWADPFIIGEIRAFAMNNVPARWIAFGNVLSRTTYAALFAVIGTTWGDGDGSTTFDVPPAGYFLRSVGGVNPNDFGSATADSFASHTHGYENPQAGTGGALTAGSAFPNTSGQTTGATGGSETAPKHLTVLECIYAGQ